ncbi:hypothetical protein AVEN_116734-1 [Araneus ventricosus]|uniref:Uncharacterized protein n=1 Tax=Araneus ventricosus TaxID=182803 RepID=A0A4Y2MXX3_ARAVE|nr:hypothetical protein AVEN_116734-1 [Araneus ventricosus]
MKPAAASSVATFWREIFTSTPGMPGSLSQSSQDEKILFPGDLARPPTSQGPVRLTSMMASPRKKKILRLSLPTPAKPAFLRHRPLRHFPPDVLKVRTRCFVTSQQNFVIHSVFSLHADSAFFDQGPCFLEKRRSTGAGEGERTHFISPFSSLA